MPRFRRHLPAGDLSGRQAGRPDRLSEDIADDVIPWLREHRALAADRPFFVYWASGACHGPHQVPKA